MRFLALLKPLLTGSAGARVLMAVAASTAVTAGVATPMAHQAYEARAEQAAGVMPAVDGTVPTTTAPSNGSTANAPPQSDPTVPPSAPPTLPPSTSTSETTQGLTPQSVAVTPTTAVTVTSTTEPDPVGPVTIPPRTTTSTTTSTPAPPPPPTIARPTTTLRTTTTLASTSTTTASTTSSTSTSTSTSTTTSTTTTLPTPTDSIYVSTNSDRSEAVLLDGQTVSGDIYVFVEWPGASVVRFYIDNPEQTGAPDRVEALYPFDLGATAPDGSAWAFDADSLGPGAHTITVEVVDNGVNVRTAAFTVD